MKSAQQMTLPFTVEKPIGSSKRLARPSNDEHASFWHELQQHPRTLAELLASPIGANFKSSPRVFAHSRVPTARRYGSIKNTLGGSSLPRNESVGLNPLTSLSSEVLLLTRYDKKKIEEITPSPVIPLIYNLLKNCRRFVTAKKLSQQPQLLQNIPSAISSEKNTENTVFRSCSTSYFTEERRLVINTDYIHINVKCSHYGESPVIGFLYICTGCQKDEVSFCSSCFRIGQHAPQHHFSVIPDPYRDTSLHALKRLDKTIIPHSFLLTPLEYCTSPNFLISELILMEIVFRRIAGQHESGAPTMSIRKFALLFFWKWSGVEGEHCLTEKDIARVCRHVDVIEFREFCCLVHLKRCTTQQTIIKHATNGETAHEEDNALAELYLRFVNRNNTMSALVSVELGLLRLLAMLSVFEALETEHTAEDINDVRRLYIHTLHIILTQDALLHSNEGISGEETRSSLKLPVEGTGVLDCCALLVLLQHCAGVFHPHKKIEAFDKNNTFLTQAIDRMNAKLKTPRNNRRSNTILHNNRETIHTTNTNTNGINIPSGSHKEEKNNEYTPMVPL
ncbi:hypothetical protein LSM04_000071 [Trypanosoma melophagium]|uniref:uncharacterized protein n=1 Tax=Trypanosoma melophagium TaxID=715481 RepID=UPI00351A081A|nr:hypothetical protein LSM04_000071 [Trypanosoma melophagium]